MSNLDKPIKSIMKWKASLTRYIFVKRANLAFKELHLKLKKKWEFYRK